MIINQKDVSSMSICNYNKEKMCDLYYGNTKMQGAAYDIHIKKEKNGKKQQEFKIPTRCIDENGDSVRNHRLEYLKNEYLILVNKGEKKDWYILHEPSIMHTGKGETLSVICGHVASLLRMKKLYMELDDSNGIGTCDQIAKTILSGTGWKIGQIDTFYEADGSTEKVRTLTASSKTGAYQMIMDLCSLYNACPIFNGEERTVDIRAFKPFDVMDGDHIPDFEDASKIYELHYDHAMQEITRTLNTDSLITRLYVEGSFGDDGYLGIESVNPTGMNFILDFSYYKAIGIFDQNHEAAVDAYLADMLRERTNSINATTAINEKQTELMTLWGTAKWALYDVREAVSTNKVSVELFGSSEEMPQLEEGQEVAFIFANGKYKRTFITQTSGSTIDFCDVIDEVDRMRNGRQIVYITPASGRIGGKEVAVEAIEEVLNNEVNREDPSQEIIDDCVEKINAIYDGDEDNSGLYDIIEEADVVARQLVLESQAYKKATQNISDIETKFANIMGDMLRDGYWQDNNYIPGLEESLYKDALKTMSVMCRPVVTYVIKGFNMSSKCNDVDSINGHSQQQEWPMIDIDFSIHIVDPSIDVNTWGYLTSLDECFDAEQETSFAVSTEDKDIAGQSFTNVLSRIADVADQLKDKEEVFQRAKIISADGKISSASLNGKIDLLTVQLMSTMSNMYTDEIDGSLIFVGQDERTAMKQTGSGFMIASGKKDDGSWNWRTFGNGNGFTADCLTAGEVNAGSVRILGTEQFYWDADNIYIINPNNNNRQIRIGRYDGVNYGIAFTQDDGYTWSTAINFDGLSLSYLNISTDMINGIDNYLTKDQAIDEYGTIRDINAVEDDLAAYKALVATNIQFGQSGISIGRESSKIHSLFSNDALEFYEEGQTAPIAYFRERTLYANKVNATGDLAIGKFSWIVNTTDGSVALKWMK